MNVEIIDTPFILNVYGLAGEARNKAYSQTAFCLSERVWRVVKKNSIKNKGKNVWVYEENDAVFAGVELQDDASVDRQLEQKTIHLTRYAYYRHVGSYALLKQAGMDMRDELKRRGIETCLPYVEIYGHWSNDESKLETELFMSLK